MSIRYNSICFTGGETASFAVKQLEDFAERDTRFIIPCLTRDANFYRVINIKQECARSAVAGAFVRVFFQNLLYGFTLQGCHHAIPNIVFPISDLTPTFFPFSLNFIYRTLFHFSLLSEFIRLFKLVMANGSIHSDTRDTALSLLASHTCVEMRTCSANQSASFHLEHVKIPVRGFL